MSEREQREMSGSELREKSKTKIKEGLLQIARDSNLELEATWKEAPAPGTGDGWTLQVICGIHFRRKYLDDYACDKDTQRRVDNWILSIVKELKQGPPEE